MGIAKQRLSKANALFQKKSGLKLITKDPLPQTQQP